ncbi:MAG: hypothetical protein ACOCU4_05515 [Alkalispirochaeta sp.]
MSERDEEFLYDDEDNRNWEARFGTSYVEDDYTGDDLEESDLDQLESEFRRSEQDHRAEFGQLEEMNDDNA